MVNSNLYKIYLFNVKFTDKKGSKERPVVTIFYDQSSLSFKLLGIYSDKPKYHDNQFYHQFMYKINDYKEAGLDYPSWINVRVPLEIPFTYFLGKRPIGKLTLHDSNGLIDLFEKYYFNKN